MDSECNISPNDMDKVDPMKDASPRVKVYPFQAFLTVEIQVERVGRKWKEQCRNRFTLNTLRNRDSDEKYYDNTDQDKRHDNHDNGDNDRRI